MVDFTTMGAAAGLNLAQRLLYQWITKGKVRVKTSKIDADIAHAAREEADRLRMRVDDLENFTRQLLEQLVVITPQLTYVRPRLRAPELLIDFNPRDSQSSKELLQQLDSRVKLIADEVSPPTRAPHIPRGGEATLTTEDVGTMPPTSAGFTVVEPAQTTAVSELSPASSTAQQMLEDLRRRVEERENPRS